LYVVQISTQPRYNINHCVNCMESTTNVLKLQKYFIVKTNSLSWNEMK